MCTCNSMTIYGMYVVQNASLMLWNGRTAKSIGSWKFVVINFSSDTSASSKPAQISAWHTGEKYIREKDKRKKDTVNRWLVGIEELHRFEESSWRQERLENNKKRLKRDRESGLQRDSNYLKITQWLLSKNLHIVKMWFYRRSYSLCNYRSSELKRKTN